MEFKYDETTLDTTLEEIKKEWFENHKATIEKQGTTTIIRWQTPGEFMYAVEFVLTGNHILVTGDIGIAVYELSCPATLENISKFNLDYLTGKLATLGKYEGHYEFNRLLAQQQFAEYWLEMFDSIEEHSDDYNAVSNLIDDCMSASEFNWRSYFELETKVELDAEVMGEIGLQTPRSIVAFWVALNQISNDKENHHA